MNIYEIVLFWFPFVLGLFFLFLHLRSRKITLGISLVSVFVVSFFQFFSFIYRPFLGPYFLIDNLNGFVLIFIGFFTLLSLVYSYVYFENALTRFFAYIFLTLSVANFTLLTNNFLLLLVGWGFLGMTLYLMINFSSPRSAASAKKTFIIVGGADAFLLLGIAILWKLTGSFNFSKISSQLTNYPTSQLSSWVTISFLCFLTASFAKAGAFPVHTWIPEISETTSIPVLAYLPASLDKLLGIYLLARVVLQIFKFPAHYWLLHLVVLLGAFTVISAVMMALIQHNLRKLLSYHAVSQVGYMVLGIGTLNPLGFIGGLFHMLNNAIYKSCLFFTAGNVEKRTQTLELDKLGGLGKVMPFTFIAMLIASLSISGVPPLNGFYSKWMVYQGLISGFTSANISFFSKSVYILSLVMALIGSALTLASFLKVIYGVFLGQKSEYVEKVKEVGKMFLFPVLILSLLCIIFGLWAQPLVLKYLITPLKIEKPFGVWMPGLTTGLIILSLFIGLLIFIFNRVKFRYADNFIGGESLSSEVRPRATEFYMAIKEMSFLSQIYKLAEKKIFDFYEICLKIIFVFIRFLRYLHNGVLPTYLVWCLIGMLILIFKFIR